MINILLSGASGRMGREIAAQIRERADINCLAGIDPVPGEADFPCFASFSEIPEALYENENTVVIDFSSPNALSGLLAFCRKNHLPAVLGATGYSDDQRSLIEACAKEIPLFQSSNMSLGVYVLGLLAAFAAELLKNKDFDIEIVEKHHRQKKDAPSGTAKMLYDKVADAHSAPEYDRHTDLTPRQKNEIGLSSVRGGTVAGEHQIGFYGNGETVLIEHVAQDRSIFAVGALRAASFVLSQPAGLYGMDDLAGKPARG